MLWLIVLKKIILYRVYHHLILNQKAFAWILIWNLAAFLYQVSLIRQVNQKEMCFSAVLQVTELHFQISFTYALFSKGFCFALQFLGGFAGSLVCVKITILV